MYTTTYDALYEFAPCPAGSRRELLWRLLIRNTVHEGLSIDDLAFQARARTFLGQERIARTYAAILADEIHHARLGIRWTRHLCNGDEARAFAEREEAAAYYNDVVARRRRQYVREYPDLVIEEMAVAEYVNEQQRQHSAEFPFSPGLNEAGRRLAGFTDRDLEQAVRLGER